MSLVATTPYFGFSQHLALANSTCSSQAECISTGDMPLDESHDVSQPVFADHALMPPIYQNVHQPQTLPVSSSDHQPEVHVVRIRRVYMSDSDYMESSSEGDSEFDDDSGSSEDDEEHISAPIAVAGPSKVDKGKGKAPWSCSRLATMSERHNHHHRPRPPDPSRSDFIYPET